MSEQIEQETIDTNAGVYTVTWYYDPDTSQPEDEGFGMVRIGDRRSIDIVTDADHADDVASLIRYHRRENAYNGNIYDHEVRSPAAIARYARLKYGLKGIVEIDHEFRPSVPSADRGESFAGLAWAPDDVPDEHLDSYVRGDLKQWAAWAEGDTFGWVLTGPDGNDVEDGAVWGFYGFWDGEERDYTLSEARDIAEGDAAERVKQASTVGAGFIGLV